jgi:hypothetical protein
MAHDFSRYILVKLQNRLLKFWGANDNHVLKAWSKIAVSVALVAIAIFMGTVFFAVNEEWTAAEAFYWTITTMTVSNGCEVKYPLT